ncbi:MAG: hypothetical protein II323_01160 [Tidjanibacter sp.]|nr:hypothetical protein [Tidjanibacter sp.]
MKQLFTILSLCCLLFIPQAAAAQEADSVQSGLSYSWYLTDFEADHAQSIYNNAKWATIASGAVTATGALFWYIGELQIREQLKETDSVYSPFAAIGLLQTVIGGTCLVASLPFYLWGWDLTHQPSAEGLSLGNELKGFGFRVDLGLGGQTPVTIGGSVGYNFSSRFYAGVGAGYEMRPLDAEGPYDNAIIPIYADLRWRFGESRITPYLGVKAGFDTDTLPYGAIDWGVSYRCRKSQGAWWYALSLSNNNSNIFSLRVSRSF